MCVCGEGELNQEIVELLKFDQLSYWTLKISFGIVLGFRIGKPLTKSAKLNE